MNKVKEFRIPLSEGTMLDVTIEIEGGAIKGFALNLRCKIEDRWHQVYRVDTAHGYLHEQRFWISPEPLPITQQGPLQCVFESYMEQIRENFEQYRKYYMEKVGWR